MNLFKRIKCFLGLHDLENPNWYSKRAVRCQCAHCGWDGVLYKEYPGDDVVSVKWSKAKELYERGETKI